MRDTRRPSALRPTALSRSNKENGSPTAKLNELKQMKKELKLQVKKTEADAQILSSKESKALQSLVRASENKRALASANHAF